MIVPLRVWVEGEPLGPIAGGDDSPANELDKNQMLKRTRIAFGLTHLLKQVYQNNLVSTSDALKELCTLENFQVQTSGESFPDQAVDSTQKDIVGLGMISPRLSLQFIETSLSNDLLVDDHGNASLGTNLDVLINSNRSGTLGVERDEKTFCHFLGLLLYELFSHNFPSSAADPQHLSTAEAPPISQEGPVRKRNTAQSSINASSVGSCFFRGTLSELGFPSLINILVEDLVGNVSSRNGSECAYHSVQTACNDIRLALLEPDRVLFDRQTPSDQAANGGGSFQFRRRKFYGRERESTQIMNAFRRVCGTGKSEALLIGGYSGCGKTRLVDSLTDQIESVGCFVIQQKLDLFESEPYSAVIGTFNELCLKIKAQTCPAKLLSVTTDLMGEFYSDFFLLGQLLPNIYILCPQQKSTFAEAQTSQQMNLNSVIFILQRFVRIVTRTLQPVMLFLDDLQWANGASLELIQAILSDENGSSLFFVGCYRNNEVDPDDIIFDMVKKLNASGVHTALMKLQGLERPDLNSMISDTLCMFPRCCVPISAIVFHKTKGNPLFAEQFLKSLVDKGLLQYSLREKRWVWDLNRIISQSMNSCDVLGLLTSKISRLALEVQSALKIMACFGIKVKLVVVRLLGSTPQYANLVHLLDQSVREGIVLKNGQEFKFVHDKIREAVYNLIPINERDQFHLNVALLLYSKSEGDDLEDVLFFICDQLKQARHILRKDSTVATNVIGLLIKAGSKAFQQSEYPRARSYFDIAEAILPSNYWSSHYKECLHFFYLRAKSSRSCGYIEEARNALQQILTKGQSIEDTFDAHYLLAYIHYDCNEGDSAYAIGCAVLSQIHEQAPDSIDDCEKAKLIEETSNLLSRMSDDELLQLKEADKESCATLKAYSLMSAITFVMKPQIVTYFVCKLIQLTIQNGLSEYSVVGFSGFAAMHCFDMKLKNISLARRIGKCALSFQKRFNYKDQIPLLYSSYYGFVGPYTEPLQACVDMHRQAFDHGISIGDASFALCNPHFVLRSALLSGENLSKLEWETCYYQEQAYKFGHSHLRDSLEQYRGTISALASTGEIASCSSDSIIAQIQHQFHVVVQSFWLRRQDKFEESCRKITGAPVQNLFQAHMTMFFHGLNFFQHEKEKNLEKKISNAKRYIEELKRLEDHSRWNFRNKVLLLEAEVLSASEKHNEARVSYAAAIASSQESKFVHEEGLACELAGFHCMKIGEQSAALVHFGHARECYTKWGSQVKVRFIENVIADINT